MARKALIEKEKKREKLVDLKWEKRQKLKNKIKDLSSTHDEKIAAMAELNKLPKNSSPVRLRNRCEIDGRPRGYLRKFQLSRLCFREYASKGMIPGIIKASW